MMKIENRPKNALHMFIRGGLSQVRTFYLERNAANYKLILLLFADLE